LQNSTIQAQNDNTDTIHNHINEVQHELKTIREDINSASNTQTNWQKDIENRLDKLQELVVEMVEYIRNKKPTVVVRTTRRRRRTSTSRSASPKKKKKPSKK